MSSKTKKIAFLVLAWSILVAIGGGYLGWKAYEKFRGTKVIEVERPVKILVDYDDPEYLQACLERAEKDFGINPTVLKAIIECEGGNAWTISKTNDFGYWQINIKTGKDFGAKDLKDYVDCYKAVEIVAKILKQRGIDAWTKKKCIQEKLIFISSFQKNQ